MLRYSGFGVVLAFSGAAAAEPCESRYFEQLQLMCQARGNIPAESADETLTRVLGYCDAVSQPAIATGSLAARRAELEKAAQAAGIQLGESSRNLELSAQTYFGMLAQRAASDSALQTGAGVDALASELLQRVCSEPGLQTWLPATCTPLAGGPVLIELRQRLLSDLVTLPRRQAANGGAAAMNDEMRASLALLSAALSPDPLWRLALELAPPVTCDALSAPPLPTAAEPLLRAGTLLQRALSDGAVGARRSAEYLRAVLENEVRRLQGQAQLSPAQTSAIHTLAQALFLLQQAPPQTQLSADALAARLEPLATVITSALGAVAVGPTALQLSPAGLALARAVVRADLQATATHAVELSRATGALALSDKQIELVQTAVRFALARDEDEARRIVRGLIIPLGRWSESVLFDINADVPKLDRGNFRIVGDLLLGYSGKSWGIVGQGAAAEYDFSSDNEISETTALDGGLESWLAINLDAKRRLKLELRLTSEAGLYDTNNTDAGFSDETSIMARGALLVSLRYQGGERVAGGLWLGGGAQYEWYDTVDAADAVVGLETTETLGVLLNARARVEVGIVPRWLAARLRVDALRYGITRQSLRTVAGMNMIDEQSARLDAEQLEVRARLFLDAEVARFGGFVPSINAGFDSLSFESDEESHSAFVPVFGVGVRRDAF